MLNERHEVAQTIAKELLPAEKEIDNAIVRNARLTIAVVEGRCKLRLPLNTGQEGLDLVCKANASLVHARGLMAEAHMAFRATQSEVGLDAFSYGDIVECPAPSKATATSLRRVA